MGLPRAVSLTRSIVLCVAVVRFGLIQVRAQTAQNECECTLYYLCDAENTVTASTKCSGPEVCCRLVNLLELSSYDTAPSGTKTGSGTKGAAGGIKEGAGGSGNGPNELIDETPKTQCDCKPAADCPHLSGAFQLDIRFSASNGKCPSVNDVCCPEPKRPNPNTNTTPSHTRVTEQPELLEECGMRKGRSNDEDLRITAPNSESQFGEFPWMMAILTNKINEDGTIQDNVFQCGASLIQPNVVLTAAHCVYNLRPEDIKVRAGEWDTVSQNDPRLEPHPFQEVTVSEILLHDGFELSTVYNDIALLILTHPVKLHTHIGLVCTPNYEEEYDPQSCLVMGWGKEHFGKSGQYQTKLRFLDLKLVDRQTCQQQLRQTRLGPYFRLHESFLCGIGDQNKDACKGDGGGPLVCRLRSDPQRYTQVGIVAWGIGCGGGTPGVYVDVYKFKRWILNNSKGNRVHTRIVQ